MVTDWEPDPDDPKDINVSQEDEDVSKSKVNTIFETLGLTPIKLREINRSKDYLYTKLKELQDAVLLGLGIQEEIDSENESDKSINSILNNIKDEYKSFNKQERVAVIKILPKHWSKYRIKKVIGASSHSSTNLVDQVLAGRVTYQRKEHKNKLSSESEQTIHDFYLDERISRCLPGTILKY